MYKCKVCGKEFELKVEGHYISRDDGKSGLARLAGGSEDPLYDTFDCPHCGCQNVMQARKRRWEGSGEVIVAADAEEEKPECFGCFEDRSEDNDVTCLLCECEKECKQATEKKEAEEGVANGEDE